MEEAIPEEDVKIEELVNQAVVGSLSENFLSDKPVSSKKEIKDRTGEIVTIKAVTYVPSATLRETKRGGQQYREVLCKIELEDSEIINLGGLRQYYQDGTFGPFKLWVQGSNAMAKLFKKYCEFANKTSEELSMKEFHKGLIGSKVMLKFETINFAGQTFPKNTIAKFVE